MKESKQIKFIAIILGFIMIFQYISVIIPFVISVANEYTDENGITWSYELNNNRVENLKPQDKDNLPATVTIPDKINGYTVYSIANEAFKGCNSLEEVTIKISNQDSIIGQSAFENCTSLTKLNIEGLIRYYRFSCFL